MYGVIYIILAVGLAILPLYVQWKIIELGLPWIGKLVGLLIIPLGWVYFRSVIMPQPSDCIEPVSCEWAGIMLWFITLFSIVDMILATIGGYLIHHHIQKRVWAPDDTVLQAGKIPYVLFLIISLLVAGYYIIAISGIPSMLRVWFERLAN